MKTRVYIDGSEGTTGLRINERFQERDDIELLTIDPEKRKDPEERKKLINASDITFLCLPDVAAREAVGLIENDNVRIIDSSTAHRTEKGWSYGFPELSKEHLTKIQTGKRIAVPGCYATGFIALAYPLVAGGIMPADYPVSIFAASGYSGGGKKLIAEYEAQNRDAQYSSARFYGFPQMHKHLKEMQKITGISRMPLFSPFTADYYSGMVVQLPLYTDLLKGKKSPEQIRDYLDAYYKDSAFIEVMPFGAETARGGTIFSNACSGWDGLRIYVTGNEERVVAVSCFDNLGKGASGAAIQCMNLMIGCEEAKGLHLF